MKVEYENAVIKREKELLDEGNKHFEEDKVKLLQGVTTLAPEASEWAAAEFQRISAAAVENAKREQQKREETEKEYNARLADYQRQMNQREQQHAQELNQKQETQR